ncbi:MAG TPA: aminotransferase class V-fold PLP-dependent enzyme [Nitrospirota bacterium]|jgi:cysteine desulfurase family protein
MIYLDNAATSHPKPEEVYVAVDTALRSCSANPGRSGHKMALEANRLIFEARENISRLFGIKHPERIIFTQNATGALNLAIKGLLAPGDHCVTTSIEHNSVVRPLHCLSRQGIGVGRVNASEEGLVDPENIAAAINKKTRLVAVNHASNVIGTINPVAKIAAAAHDRGVPVLVDASQTAGTVSINVEESGIDLLACPGHKGLLGPQGTGFLYVAPHINLKPILFGGTGSRSDIEDMPDFLPDRHEAGTLNTPGIAGLNAGVLFLIKTGVESVFNHEDLLCKMLIEGLSDIPGVKVYGPGSCTRRAAVISFNIGDIDPSTIGNRLDAEFDIAVRVGIHCAPGAHRTIGTYPRGTVRVSPGYFTKQEDIETAVEALKTIAGCG